MHQVANQLLREDLQNCLHRLVACQLCDYVVSLLILIVNTVDRVDRRRRIAPVGFLGEARSEHDHPLVCEDVILEIEDESEKCVFQVCVHSLETAQHLVRDVAQVAHTLYDLQVDKFGFLGFVHLPEILYVAQFD